MAKQKRLDTTTGNGITPILEGENAPTVARLQPAPVSRGPASISLGEALSLLQTDCFDLRSMGCKVQMLGRKNRLYLILETPSVSDTVKIEDGHILLRDRPVILESAV